MSQRVSKSAPYEIHSIDIHAINDVFRQIQHAVDELKGLAGPFKIYDSVDVGGDLTVDGDTTLTGDLTVNNITFSSTGAVSGLDASDVTYTPADVTDWGSDPGNVDDALDFLIANSGGGSSDLIDSDTTPWEELVGDATMRVLELGGGNAAQLHALEPITVGDSLIGELQLLDDGNDEVIYA